MIKILYCSHLNSGQKPFTCKVYVNCDYHKAIKWELLVCTISSAWCCMLLALSNFISQVHKASTCTIWDNKELYVPWIKQDHCEWHSSPHATDITKIFISSVRTSIYFLQLVIWHFPFHFLFLSPWVTFFWLKLIVSLQKRSNIKNINNNCKLGVICNLF
jgi:hypothetical protein